MNLLKRYLDRGWILLLACLLVSVMIFWGTTPHDTEPFLRVVSVGIPAWFAVNMVERFAIDRLRVRLENGVDKTP